MSENVSENKMGTMPVGRLIFTMSLPMIVSMLVQALYNVVDSMFVARLSQDALSAVTMVFPVQNLMIAFSVGMGVGVNALLSRSLGQGDRKKVSSAAMQGILLFGAMYAIFLVLGLFFSEFYMRSQTDIEDIVRGGTEYMTVVCAASFGLFAQVYCEKMLQGTGRTVLSMAVQGVGAIINIILDPILIFGRITLPLVGTVAEFTPLGVAGAAWATVIGQTLAAVLGIFLNIRMNREIHFDRALLRPEPHTLKAILSVGIPSGFIGSIGSVMTYFYNRILIGFSSACVSAFGAYFKLESFVLMPVYGLNNGTVPIIAYNYGARRPDRMKKSVRISVISAEVVVLVGFAVFQLFPGQLLSLFNPDEEMLKIGIRALRTISLSFITVGFSTVITSVFQALGHGLMSMSVFIVRQIFVVLPSAYLFSLSGNVGLVWFAFPIAELVSLIMCTVFYSRVRKLHMSDGAAKASLPEKE